MYLLKFLSSNFGPRNGAPGSVAFFQVSRDADADAADAAASRSPVESDKQPPMRPVNVGWRGKMVGVDPGAPLWKRIQLQSGLIWMIFFSGNSTCLFHHSLHLIFPCSSLLMVATFIFIFPFPCSATSSTVIFFIPHVTFFI